MGLWRILFPPDAQSREERACVTMCMRLESLAIALAMLSGLDFRIAEMPVLPSEERPQEGK